MEACMGMILPSVPLLTHQSCRVPTVTFWHFDNSVAFNLDILFPHSIQFPLFCSTINVFFSWSRSCLLTKTAKMETTHCFKHCVATSREPICIQRVNLFLSSCCVKALNSAVRFLSLKIQHDHIFETSGFVLTGLNLCKSASNSILV